MGDSAREIGKNLSNVILIPVNVLHFTNTQTMVVKDGQCIFMVTYVVSAWVLIRIGMIRSVAWKFSLDVMSKHINTRDIDTIYIIAIIPGQQ
jgi:hypothetical protein